MTYKNIYNDLKLGYEFTDEFSYVCIGTCDRYNSPSYGKDYIYYRHYGAGAFTVSFKNLRWIMHHVFDMKANEFYEKFTKN